MKTLTNTQVIAECKREAKKAGFKFSATGFEVDGEKLYQFHYKNGEFYRDCKLGLAYDIVCSGELDNALKNRTANMETTTEPEKIMEATNYELESRANIDCQGGLFDRYYDTKNDSYITVHTENGVMAVVDSDGYLMFDENESQEMDDFITALQAHARRIS